MAKRDKLFQKFGPLLLEALVKVLVDEMNLIHPGQGLPDVTYDDVFNKVENHLSHLEPYDWLKEGL